MVDSEHPVLSVLMPVYNEIETAHEAISRVEKSDLGASVEIVVVDDGSSDGTIEILRAKAADNPDVRLVEHVRNRGKGAAIRTALQHASGRFACIYDADLEYDPDDMRALLEPLLDGRAEVSFGVRAFGGMAAHSYWYVVGNRSMTLATNVLFNCYLRDVMTCFKMMPLSLFRSLELSKNRFDIEPEITGKLLVAGHRIYEVPISYRARSHEEGKKLGSKDAWSVLRTLAEIRLRAVRRKRQPASDPKGSVRVVDREAA